MGWSSNLCRDPLCGSAQRQAGRCPWQDLRFPFRHFIFHSMMHLHEVILSGAENYLCLSSVAHRTSPPRYDLLPETLLLGGTDKFHAAVHHSFCITGDPLLVPGPSIAS